MKGNKERFLSLFTSYVNRDGAKDLLSWLDETDFFCAPASTRYHGSVCGGLVAHCLNVYDCLQKELDSHGLEAEYSQETVAIVALLHDICKVNFYKKGFRNVKNDKTGQWERKEVYEVEEKFPCGDHADKSIIIIQNFIKLNAEEILAIRAHMGAWDNASRGGSQLITRIFERSRLAVLLHIADMKATYFMEGRNGGAT